MDMITLYLKLAFSKPGCPICRLRRESEEPYLFNLLWENVNDGPTRRRRLRGNWKHKVDRVSLCPKDEMEVA